MNSKKNNILTLIGPDFFSYIQAIRDELIKRGYVCYYKDERHSNSIITKIAYRLQLTNILKSKRDIHLSKILKEIFSNGTTDVYLIDIEVITTEFVTALRAQGIRVHIYMWDSARNKDSFLELLPLLDSSASFEPDDCKKYDMKYIPLFAENVFSKQDITGSRNNELVFLGTLHSHRATLLSALEKSIGFSGFKIRKLLYYHSKLLYIIKSLTNPETIKYLGDLRTKGYSKKEIATAYFTCKGVLDIHHPGQAGLTSRTFESLRAGAWLITLNKTVLSLPEELQKRIILLSNVNDLEKRVTEVTKQLPKLSEKADYFLSLDRFTDDLLDAAGIEKLA
jgi:hypothetical protein